MKFLQNANYEGHLLDILKTGGKVKDIACAVAFWGEHAEKYLTIMVADTTPEDERDFGVEGSG